MIVNAGDVFPAQYYKEILRYKETIKTLFNSYDVIIFMARKAICFYKSMLINEMFSQPKDCMVLSSRVLDYNISEILKNKKIVVVDDVVLKGNSLIKVLEKLNDINIEVDIYIVACTDSFIKNNRSQLKECLIGSYSTLSETNTYQLSQYITEYIEASMCPNNVDQPIYQIFFHSNNELKVFLERSRATKITSPNQKRFDIQSYTLHFSKDSCRNFLDSVGDVQLIDDVKIRFMYKKGSNELIAIPFVLLSEMTYEYLNRNYNKISTPKLDELLKNSDNSYYENKLKCVHYYLAAQLFSAFVSNSTNIASYSRLNSNDNYTFAFNIFELIPEFLTSNYEDISFYQQYTNSNTFEFNTYLSLSYDYIFSEDVNNQTYFNAHNKTIANEIITLNNIRSHISKHIENFDNLIFSNTIDVLIDRGILVPSIFHGNRKTIIRGYKCGEIYRLTTELFKLFAYMLGLYSHKLDRPLYKTELEKLCVLFFRKIEKEQFMEPVDKNHRNRQDEYSICYSKFGPRVSTSNPIYSANDDSVLASKLITYNHIEKAYSLDPKGVPREMYQIEYHGHNSPNDETWDITATRFAIQYANLYTSYVTLSKSIKSTYIQTYIEFIILLSIGLNKRNQLLSLLAELYLFTNIDINPSIDIKEVLLRVNNIVNGLVSGMWKYMCYSRKVHPLRDAYKKMLSFDENMVLAFDLDSTSNKSVWVTSLIEESGTLIYQTMYTIYFLCRKHEVHCKFDMENQKKREFYYDKTRDLRKNIEAQICNDDCNGIDDVQLLIALQNQANQCINKFDLEETPIMSKRFKIAFSFAGEHRELVEQIVDIIRISGFSKDELLYDRYHEAEFSIPDLDTHLYNLYSQNSELIVVFLSYEYIGKSWPKTEYRAIRRLFNEGTNNSRIMFIRLDESEIEGVSHLTDGAVSASRHTPPAIAELILERYRKDVAL